MQLEIHLLNILEFIRKKNLPNNNENIKMQTTFISMEILPPFPLQRFSKIKDLLKDSNSKERLPFNTLEKSEDELSKSGKTSTHKMEKLAD